MSPDGLMCEKLEAIMMKRRLTCEAGRCCRLFAAALAAPRGCRKVVNGVPGV